MEVVGNTRPFQAIFFIRIENQYRIDNERMVFYLVGLSETTPALVTDWFRKTFSLLEEGGGPYLFFSSPR